MFPTGGVAAEIKILFYGRKTLRRPNFQDFVSYENIFKSSCRAITIN